ncbi:MAG: TerB family tellurite resistance protein [Emcibacter sp.]|nr:TerB family tellurite resistance protein [Emcibacter sp.]
MSILKRLSAFNRSHNNGNDNKNHDEKLAAAALMVEVAAQDGVISRSERERILFLLEHKLDLSKEEALEIFVEALATQNDSNQILGFTKKIKDHFDEMGRERILTFLWEVVFADGSEDDYESNLMRRIAGLLYISDKKSGHIRKNIQENL